MKYSYQFKNLMGTVYHRGNVEFLSDGNTVVSPVGNRISLYDLKSNKSETLPVALKRNISCLTISPDNHIMIAVDEEGEAFMISLKNKTVIHRKHMGKPISSVSFSPDGSKFVMSKGCHVLMYHSPSSSSHNPFTLIKTFYTKSQASCAIKWSCDGRVFVVGCHDSNARIFPSQRCLQLKIYSIKAHRSPLAGCFFEKDSLDFYTIGSDGSLSSWVCDTDLKDLTEIKFDKVAKSDVKDEADESDDESEDDDEESGNVVVSREQLLEEEAENKIQYTRRSRHWFNKEGDYNNVTTCSFHNKTKILVTGFASGVFYLHELPQFLLIHSLSITEHAITSSCFNGSGDWLTLGSSSMGQLMVWEWQSESYIMKQQGHFDVMRTLDYSPDGQLIATGGEDSKVKVWNTSSGFCFVTFKEHRGPISEVMFTSSGQVVLSASLDGTVRAFDLNRYRNFRTFVTPGEEQQQQLTCLAVDSSSEFVCAASYESFEVFVWSMKTGRLLEVLSGHEAPVSSLSFAPPSGGSGVDSDVTLASGSWDQCVGLWRICCEKPSKEVIQLNHDVLDIAFRPDGKELAVSTLNAELSFFEVETCNQKSSIDCRLDIVSGRGELDRISSKNQASSKAYETVCYSADGSVILVGGFSKFICLYDVAGGVMLRRFEVCHNLSFDGMEEYLNRRKMTDFGPQALIDMDGDPQHQQIRLPGVKHGDMSERAFKPDIRVPSLKFSPTGREWSAVTTEGLVVYSLDNVNNFDPFHLDIEITPSTIRSTLKEGNYLQSVMMSFRLNLESIKRELMEQIPTNQIDILVKSLPLVYIEKMMTWVSDELDNSTHTHFYLLWSTSILAQHGTKLKLRSSHITPQLTHLLKALAKKDKEITKLMDSNAYLMEYIFKMSQLNKKVNKEKEEENCDDYDVNMIIN